jgi:lysozyme
MSCEDTDEDDMDDTVRMRLTAQLKRDEGVRRTGYRDSVGVLTIGVGHNLSRPLSDQAIDQILADDVRSTEADLVAALPWVTTLSGPRQGVLVAMAFNLGVSGLLEFRQMLAAIQAENWEQAADAMRDSKWAEQVGARASRLEQQMYADAWA